MKQKYFLILFTVIFMFFISSSLCTYAGDYKNKITSPVVKVNPYDKNPLCAFITFETKEPSKIELTIKGKKGAQDINHSFPEFSQNHKIPVLGLYPDYNNKVIITAINKDGEKQSKEIRIKTKKINTSIRVEILEKTVRDPKYYFLTESVVLDEEGNIRLFFNDIKGAVLYYSNNEIISENRLGGLTRYSVMGEELQKYPYPVEFTSFGHGLTQKPNGNFLVIGSFQNQKVLTKENTMTSQHDFIIEIDYKTGKVVNKIDLARLLNPLREVNVKTEKNEYGLLDWCHVNGVDYDASDGSIIATSLHSGIFKIKDKTNELVWIIAPNKGFEVSGRDGKGPDISKKVLTAVDKKDIPFSKEIQQGAFSETDYFKWPTTAHNAEIYENNILAVYDNSGDIYDTSVYTTKTANASIYKIDEKNGTLRQIWLKSLDLLSDKASSVTYNEKDNEVVVFTQVSKVNNNPIYHVLTRYDFDTQKVLFSAKIYFKGRFPYLYKSTDFRFYPEEN